jgi:hypothetical protein
VFVCLFVRKETSRRFKVYAFLQTQPPRRNRSKMIAFFLMYTIVTRTIKWILIRFDERFKKRRTAFVMTERLVVVLCDLVKVVRTDVAKEERKIAEDIYVYLLGVCAIDFFVRRKGKNTYAYEYNLSYNLNCHYFIRRQQTPLLE